MATRIMKRQQALQPDLPHAGRLARRMTFNIAAAVLVYAAIQLWLVIGAVSEGASRFLPHVALGIMVLGVIPAARRIERRWARFAETALPSRQLCQSFRNEALRLWCAAIALPFLWVGAFVGASAAASIVP
ncbi:MAG: hypothetical protein GW859_05730 [Sphingomonadales bacterium]|nr:hypothetical protein [Sphingomonadales bacterium]